VLPVSCDDFVDWGVATSVLFADRSEITELELENGSSQLPASAEEYRFRLPAIGRS
jgi:hypothetical protein